MSRAALDHQRARTHKRAAARIAGFLRQRGVTVKTIDYTRRRMEIEGPTRVLTELFGAKVSLYANADETFRARTGSLRIPRHIASWVRAVVGFDKRPLTACSGVNANGSNGPLWPTQVAELYGVPLNRVVANQCVGIVAMGGGYDPDDLKEAMRGMGRQIPDLIDVSVGGAVNQVGVDSTYDEEIALDLQVLAALVPGARIVIYFCVNNMLALTDALDTAVHDSVNDPRVISVSWGTAERHWTAPQCEALNAILSDAARLGVSVVAAAGDELATCAEPDGNAHVWFPASSPYVLACGGTSITISNDAIADEQVWNTNGSGTGGGVSDFFPVASFQTNAGVPVSVSTTRPGRGVPDVAAMAAETPGYRIVVQGEQRNLGGTSAGTPLWAGILAIANGSRTKSLGLVTPYLYANRNLMRPIQHGDNKANGVGYDAGDNWSACTGLGAPIGTTLIEALTVFEA